MTPYLDGACKFTPVCPAPDEGQNVIGFEQQLVRFTKIMVLIAVTSTGGCAVLLLAVQLRFLVQFGEWNPYSVSSFSANRDDTYSVASTNKIDPNQLDTHPVVEWVLDLPAILPLLIAFAALLGFWMLLSKIEKHRFRA
jgi:hypothetical protein